MYGATPHLPGLTTPGQFPTEKSENETIQRDTTTSKGATNHGKEADVLNTVHRVLRSRNGVDRMKLGARNSDRALCVSRR